MDACDGLFPLIKVCFVWSEMNRPELQTYIFEHISASNVYVPVGGLSGFVRMEVNLTKQTMTSTFKKGNICNNSSHIREKNTVWIWEERILIALNQPEYKRL